MYGARFTNETAVDAYSSPQAVGVAMPGRSCSWITSFPSRGAVGTRFRTSGSFADLTTAFTLDNALVRYISQRKSPSSGRALQALEAQRDRRMRPIRTRIVREEADRAARNCPKRNAVGSRRTRPISGQGLLREATLSAARSRRRRAKPRALSASLRRHLKRKGGSSPSGSTPQTRPGPRTAVRDVTNHKSRGGRRDLREEVGVPLFGGLRR